MSGYSELLGLFPPKRSSLLSFREKHEPPMKLRVSHDGYLPIDEIRMAPVFNHLSENDDLSYRGCPYTGSYDEYHWSSNDSFTIVADYILPVVRKPFCQIFGIDINSSYNMTYPDFYDLADVLLAEDFEGQRTRKWLSSQQWYYTRSLCRYMVEAPMDEKGRNLFITKLFREPLALL